jgi:hypothetical protein
MGAIDLVVQIESPPSVASGLQRIGRAGHQVGAASEGVIFPKFRGDLVACAAVARAMHEGKVESTRYPRNPLDVLAQQLVAIAGLDPWNVDDLYRLVRRAAPFADLGRRMFDGVLDMLSGRYPPTSSPSCGPRVTWDRVKNTVVGREGAVRVAIANAGTIPDRGLYGVFLAGAEKPTRVGELDEEMVFETEVGDTFTLGASTWRVEDITHDRVLVSPAPGRAGQDAVLARRPGGRPVELGLAIGQARSRAGRHAETGRGRALTEHHGLDRLAAENVLQYLGEQAAAGGVPDDRTLVIERCLDELGDWRVCVLSPLGSRIHAPWAMAVTGARAQPHRRRRGGDVGRRGFVVRFPETEQPPDPAADAARRRRGGRARCSAARLDRRSSRRASARPRRARCCCPAAAPASARRSSCSASARPISWRSRRGSGRSPSCSRPTARCCAITSTCRGWWTCCARSARVRGASPPSTPRSRRRLRRRSSSATSPTTSTTAMRRWRSGARRRCRWIRRSCASCWATPNCATCSTPMRSPIPNGGCSSSKRATRRAPPTASTTCSCASAT